MKTKKLLLFMLAGSFSGVSYAQSDAPLKNQFLQNAKKVRYAAETQYPVQVEFNNDQPGLLGSGDPQTIIAQALDLPNELGLTQQNRTHYEGITHYRFQQTFKGIPVENGVYTLHKKDGRVKSMNGYLYHLANINTQPQLNEKQALENAKSAYGAQTYAWEDKKAEKQLKKGFENELETYFPKGQLVLFPEGGKYTINANFKLAYKFDIYASEPFGAKRMYIDAGNGNLMASRELIHTSDLTTKAKSRYSGDVEITVDEIFGLVYCLKEKGRGKGIATYDALNLEVLIPVWPFCTFSLPIDLTNSRKDEAAVDAHFAAEKTYDYYLEKHNRNSIDGNGYKLVSYVHFGTDFLNAFWDGKNMVYGDGNNLNNYNPLTTLDVGGHEITHGLVNFSSNLEYLNESGALNESFADIFGNVIQHYAKPQEWEETDWLLGEEMDFPIRDMCNPKAFNDPDTYQGEFWAPLDGPDNGGVHTNSGVQNKWFCLLVNGGTGVNDNGDTYNVNGLGWEKAEKIAFDNAVNRLTPNSTYEDARANSLAAAADLYGECSNEFSATANAWHAVGIGNIMNCTLTGIHDENNAVQMLTITPNPVTDNFRLQFRAEKPDNYTIEVRNLLGEIILTENLNQFSGMYNKQFQLENLSKGMYTLTLQGSNHKLVKKIIKN